MIFPVCRCEALAELGAERLDSLYVPTQASTNRQRSPPKHQVRHRLLRTPYLAPNSSCGLEYTRSTAARCLSRSRLAQHKSGVGLAVNTMGGIDDTVVPRLECGAIPGKPAGAAKEAIQRQPGRRRSKQQALRGQRPGRLLGVQQRLLLGEMTASTEGWRKPVHAPEPLLQTSPPPCCPPEVGRSLRNSAGRPIACADVDPHPR